jgi:hypothetical protein
MHIQATLKVNLGHFRAVGHCCRTLVCFGGTVCGACLGRILRNVSDELMDSVDALVRTVRGRWALQTGIRDRSLLTFWRSGREQNASE